MNIYITRPNETFLRQVLGTQTNGFSMSGLINKLIDDYRHGEGADLFPPENYGAVNIKENKDGTISPQDPKKPSKFTTKSWPEVEKELKDKFRDAEQAIADQITGENPDPVKIIKTSKQAKAAVTTPKATKVKLCKHGWPLGGCFDKKKDRSCMP